MRSGHPERMPRRINLVAVQARMERSDYRDAAAFRAKIASLMTDVARTVDLALPTLVSFPELIGMYLSFVPRYWDILRDQHTLEAGGFQIIGKYGETLPEEQRARGRNMVRQLLFINTAVEAEAAYVDTFSSLAKQHNCYIGAGSIALPPMDVEPSKGGRHITDDTKVYNTAYLFSPRGICLMRTPKVQMTSGFEASVFDPGPPSELLAVETALGRIGTLVCFDGFHETLIERLDAQGVEILLKPSYNQHPWEGPSTYQPSCGEGENWLRYGCPAIIQGRENIRYGVNAMLVGAVFDDTAAEGLSSISANTGNPDAAWRDGILAIATAPDVEEIVAATVDLG
jgi:predicted amidohydrolase